MRITMRIVGGNKKYLGTVHGQWWMEKESRPEHLYIWIFRITMLENGGQLPPKFSGVYLEI